MAFWSKTPAPPNGSPSPVAMVSHNSAEINKSLFIFGGWTGSKFINDLYVLHTPTMRWSKPTTTGTYAQPRAGHSLTAVGEKLFVFGGAENGVFFNDLQIFDTERMCWIQAYVTGTNPAARSRHTANLIPTVVSNGRTYGTYIIFFGGGDERSLYDDLYVLNTETLQWSRIEAAGTPPSPRWGHTTTLIDRKLYVFGGHDGTKRLNDLFVLDLGPDDSFESLSWSQPTLAMDSTVPPARAGHTADPVGRKIFVYGGGDGKVLSDLYYFDVDNITWSRMNGTSPGRCAHSSTVIDGKLYIFGGGNGTKCFKDMYIFDAEQFIKSEDAKQVRLKNKLKVKQKLEIFLEQKAKTVQQRVAEKEEEVSSHISDYLELREWLRGIGLERYAQNFIQEEIDIDIIHSLTEEHLKRMGIHSLSSRLAICAAVDKMKKGKESSLSRSSSSSGLITMSSEEQFKEISKTIQMSVQTINMATLTLYSRFTH